MAEMPLCILWRITLFVAERLESFFGIIQDVCRVVLDNTHMEAWWLMSQMIVLMVLRRFQKNVGTSLRTICNMLIIKV